MALDPQDMQYFDGKFGEVHRRIDEVKESTNETVGKIRQDMNEIRMEQVACKAEEAARVETRLRKHKEDDHSPSPEALIEKHEKGKHNIGKAVGILAAAIASIGGGLALLSKLLNG